MKAIRKIVQKTPITLDNIGLIIYIIPVIIKGNNI